MTSVRPPAVAGSFYPGSREALSEMLETLFAGVDPAELRLDLPKALIVPHAGYQYSGAIAAHAYAEAARARGLLRRVVMLGPAHRVPVRGLAAPKVAAFETPLGRVPIDVQALRALAVSPHVVESDAVHALEHSLEVQLPFLQRVLGEFTLVPLAVGEASTAQVAEVLERLWGGPETLIVLSTDLSHYHPYEAAKALDGRTFERIAAFADDLDHDEACGATPLNGLLRVARRRGLGVRRLAACNSGDTGGGRGEVVGYGALGLYETPLVSHDEAGRALLSIARGAIECALAGSQAPEPAAAWLAQSAATFVTLVSGTGLRGCIGSLEAVRALALDVAHNARAAAFSDPRFPALAASEWPRCRVEVSLLSNPRRLCFRDEEDLLVQLAAGEDGLILEHSGRRGTFLPQVWDSLPDKRDFLRELRKKAGIPAHAALAECSVSRYRVVKWMH